MSTGLDTKVLVGATGVLAIKLYATLMIQGSKRFAAGTRPPEDQVLTKFNPTNQPQAYGVFDEAADAKKPSIHAVQVDIRWERIVRNDLENIPIGLLTSWAAVNSGGNIAVNVGAISAFTLFRILHTIAYAKELQPHRARFWGIGVLSVLTLIGSIAFGLISNM
ncbi:hypothetical protein AC1031_008236 [Aphanomyces cochlioides]|nr:hypothetical protein AC1031_008236 [Aphanomyces cochlioides]